MALAKVLGLVKGTLLLLAPQLKSDASVAGNKELKEGVRGTLLVSALLARHFQDGVQVLDFPKMWKQWGDDPSLQAAVKAAYEDADKIPAEAKDLDLGESLEVVAEVADGVPALVAALTPGVEPASAA